jgi:hypothetical protein
MKDTHVLGLTALLSTGLSVCLLIGMLSFMGMPPSTPYLPPTQNLGINDENWSDWSPAGTIIKNAYCWNDWPGSGSAFFRSADGGEGGYYAHYKDAVNEQIVPTRSITSHYMVDGDYVEVDIYSITSPSAGNINFFLYSGSSQINQICLGDDEIYAYNNGVWNIVGTNTTVGHWISIRITRAGETTWKIAQSYEGGTYYDSSTFTNIGSNAYSTNPIDKIGFNCLISTSGEYLIRHIDLSWT